MISLSNITKQFGGVKALDSVTFDILPERITSIIGPNGSGKSTLVNVLTGVFPMDKGSVMLARGMVLESIKSEKVFEYGMTRTFQGIRLIEQMSVYENVMFGISKRNIGGALTERDRRLYDEKVREVLERVDMWDKRHKHAGDLSYGQRKLVEIARALVTDADIYFFDEPYAGLFPEMVKVVTRVLKELREHGKTVVLIEHNMDIIRELSDTVVVLDAGKLLAEGKPGDVLERKDVIEAYLGN